MAGLGVAATCRADPRLSQLTRGALARPNARETGCGPGVGAALSPVGLLLGEAVPKRSKIRSSSISLVRPKRGFCKSRVHFSSCTPSSLHSFLALFLGAHRSHERRQLRGRDELHEWAFAARLRGRRRLWNDLYAPPFTQIRSDGSGTGVAYANLSRGDMVRTILRWPGTVRLRYQLARIDRSRPGASQRE